jgi:hypothetical protein
MSIPGTPGPKPTMCVSTDKPYQQEGKLSTVITVLQDMIDRLEDTMESK